ncbi:MULTISPECIES: hypothetical protein [Anoxybacillus]|uniref:MaoC like domain protein n=1 Tax=Anoxybacillus flavithermus TaxID=33934 RepID=A0A178TLE8_9BACL|nr:hypothetical protein [Anoxybacillus flavithermus]OAO77752.1 MaoC like domain protein [Anoxybacillus flavithermus]OAO82386.1 MaoC like domain protein [Anoxybacillus flavithermus]
MLGKKRKLGRLISDISVGEEILVGSLRVVPPYPFVEVKALDNF